MDALSQHLPDLLIGYAAYLLAALSPGPNVVTIMGASMSAGRRTGLTLACGTVVGTCYWMFLTLVGLSAVLAAYADALIAIKIAGGVYLLWLAYKAFRSAASAEEVETSALRADRGAWGYFLRGLAVQMTNPKSALAWIAITSLTLHEDTPLAVVGAFIGGVFVLSIVVHGFYALLFSTPAMVRLYTRARRTIQGTLAVVFTLLGVRLLASRF